MIQLNRDKIRLFIKEKNDLMLKSSGNKKLAYSGADFAYDCDIRKTSFDSIMKSDNYCVPRLESVYKMSKKMDCKIEELLIITKY